MAYPEKYIHRVDLDLLKEHNVGLIAVNLDDIRFVFKPKTEKPQDITSYYFLSEIFALECVISLAKQRLAESLAYGITINFCNAII
ncbi:MAG: hypothetical protein IPG90_12760 [Bacteroidetes bacterium]|nr:hypothetical protein [Bacteroidota bacterium]